MALSRRVVVTGTGVLCSIGDSRQQIHDSLCADTCGLGKPKKFVDRTLGFDDGAESDALVGELTDFDPSNYLEKKNYRPLNRTSLLLTSAAQLALDDSGWTRSMREDVPVGLAAGTTFCSIHTISKFDRAVLTEGPSYASPLDFANTVINAAAGQCAIWHHLRGSNSTLSSGITSALEAIAFGADLIEKGHEQAMLVGGVEELCVESILGFQRADLLCDSNSDPPIPFHSRGGFALAEGAALLMLEELESARKRGATILGEITGTGSSFDCDLEPCVKGRSDAIVDSMSEALDAANLGVRSIDAVSASANGHALMDEAELIAIRYQFSDRLNEIPVSASKLACGETMGASGAIQSIDVLAALQDQRLGAQADVADSSSVRAKFENVLVNSVGMDGNCCSLCLGRYEA